MASNGPGPDWAEHLARSEATSEQIAGELRQALAYEAALYDELAEALAQVRRRRDSYERVLSTLTGKQSAAVKQNRPKPGPGAATLEALLDALRVADEPLTQKQVQEYTGMGKSAVYRGLAALRDEQKIRLVGIAPRTGGVRGKGNNLYALMPEVD